MSISKNNQELDSSSFNLIPNKSKNILTEKEMNLKDVLLNQTLFQQNPIDQTIFQTDLIIKLRVPDQMYCKRSDKIQLGSLISKPSKTLYASYTAAYDFLFKSMEQAGDDMISIDSQDDKKAEKQLLLRKMTSFETKKESKSKNRQRILPQGQMQSFDYNCEDEYSGVIDSFIIEFNTLIYVMQQQCGFQFRTFLYSHQRQGLISKNKVQQTQKQMRKIIDQIKDKQLALKLQKMLNNSIETKRQIYILLHIPKNNLLKAANNYQIKKQIYYDQLDPFINEPMDSNKRPLRYHSKFIKEQQKNRRRKNKSKVNWKQQFEKRKKIQRRFQFRIKPYAEPEGIQNESNLKSKQIQHYELFMKNFIKQINSIDKEWDNRNNKLTYEQYEYLCFLNRGKFNPGIEKVYGQFKKQREYIKKLQELSHQQGFETFQYPEMFIRFQLAPKNKGFFDRLRQVLLFKEYTIGPYGQKALFNKMERIKLAYLVLKEHIRIQNFSLIKADLFALNDNFEKYGQIGNPEKLVNKHYQYYKNKTKEQQIQQYKIQQEEDSKKEIMRPSDQQHRKIQRKCKNRIKGGLYQSTLEDKWPAYLFFNTDFKAVRGYLGEVNAYEVFIKVKLLLLFLILSVFGIAGEMIKHLLIKPAASAYDYAPQVIFNLVYLLIATIIYSSFSEIFIHQQKVFLENFSQNNSNRYFRYDYKGPYIRNTLNDNLNDYSLQQLALSDKIKSILFLGVVVCMIGLQIGFYYLMRYTITQFSYLIEQFDRSIFYLLYPIHFIGYGIFFFINQLFSRNALEPLFKFMTQYQNRPSQDSFQKSVNVKTYLFLIATELIAPIDLVYIQYAQKSYCSAFWCFRQLQAYSYSRYIAYFVVIILRLLIFVLRLCKTKSIDLIEDLAASRNDQASISFQYRLGNYLEFIHTQSKKQKPPTVSFVDQTLNLLDFCTFFIFFPLGSFLSFLLLYLGYYIQRKQAMNNCRRPISKSEYIQKYSDMVKSIFHWMLFFNLSQMIIVLQWMEYVFYDALLAILPNPTYYTVMLVKYIIIIILTIVYEIIGKIVRIITAKRINIMEKRKFAIYKKFMQTQGRGNTYNNLQIKLPKPLTTIARIHNYVSSKILIREKNKKNKKIKNRIKSDSSSSSNSSSSESSQIQK